MRAVVNGKEREVQEESNIIRLLQDLGIKPGAVVVEINQKILKRDEWQTAILHENDAVELISYIGGG